MIAFDEILSSLDRLSPYFASQLRKSWGGTLRTHIEAVSKHRNPEGGQSIASARSALALELQDPLKKQNFGQQALDVTRNALFHSGPHLRLLTEPRTFNALMYAALVARIANNDVVIWYQDSTTSLEQRPRCGPGWLESKQHQIWLFDIARKSNGRAPTLTNAEAVRLSRDLCRLRPDTPISDLLKRTLDHLTCTEWRSYADALQDMNNHLWQQTFGRHGLRLLQIDTRFTARLVARHCLTSTSLIFKLLFEEPLRNLCKKKIERLSASELKEFVSWNTDWFWLVEGNRRFALMLQDGRLYRSGDDGDCVCSVEPGALAQKLQSGELVPNLFLALSALSWSTALPTMGGPFQLAYDPALRQVLASIAEAVGEQDDAKVIKIDQTSLGYCLIEHPLDLVETYASEENLSQVMHDLLSSPFRAVTECLSGITSSGRWSRMIQSRERIIESDAIVGEVT